MHFKFRKHQVVRILIPPDTEYIEYSESSLDSKPELKKGMPGKVNIILPNGKYHVEILSPEGETIAYAPFDEDSLEES